MKLSLNPYVNTRVYSLGEEQSPLLVEDNFLRNAELLVDDVCQHNFVQNSPLYPGIRAPAPLSFQSLLLSALGRELKQVFELKGSQLVLSLYQYSLVTLPADQLTLFSTKRDELAHSVSPSKLTQWFH